ncbi:MAG: flavodoxin domain-containing protein [Desulfobacterales bacterium]|jgi:flavorubredoxin|nr:flavodoxin domain-containing protein [Desulfobacterales bacterium]
MAPVQIAPGVYDVGVTDWNIRDFHGYSTDLGTTYNAFLVVDEKIALIDSVKKEFADQLLDNIAAVVDPRKIDFVVSNHTEPDHTGSLARVMHRVGEETPLICSKMGHKNLPRHFSQKWNYRPVGSGEELKLGKRTLVFLETRMVHWPDSMFSFLKEDGILFSSDGFGQHYAGPEKFDDEVGERIMAHAKKYFANILLLYTPLIEKLIQQVLGLKLDIRMICPDHGVIWRKDPGKIIAAYQRWCRQEPEKKAVVIYDTMWKSTQKMAEAIHAGILGEGVKSMPLSLRGWHRSELMTELFDARAVVVGSPTLNNGLYPSLADFLCYMKGLKPKNKIGAAFGSYGWSGEAVKLLEAELTQMGIPLIQPGLKIQFVPEKQQVESCREFGRQIGLAVKADSPA